METALPTAVSLLDGTDRGRQHWITEIFNKEIIELIGLKKIIRQFAKPSESLNLFLKEEYTPNTRPGKQRAILE